MSAPPGTLQFYACPQCGHDGPHNLFAVNEAECDDCGAEFSVPPGDYDPPETDDRDCGSGQCDPNTGCPSCNDEERSWVRRR